MRDTGRATLHEDGEGLENEGRVVARDVWGDDEDDRAAVDSKPEQEPAAMGLQI